MTNNEAISNLQELYPVVSEEKKQAIDKAVESLNFSIAVDNIGNQIGRTNYDVQTKGCFNCKHKQKLLTEEPCMTCSGHFNRWEDIQNGKS